MGAFQQMFLQHCLSYFLILWQSLVYFCLLQSLMFRGAANDMKQEKDRNYIIALFSGIVSFAAMVIAFVSLVKG